MSDYRVTVQKDGENVYSEHVEAESVHDAFKKLMANESPPTAGSASADPVVNVGDARPQAGSAPIIMGGGPHEGSKIGREGELL